MTRAHVWARIGIALLAVALISGSAALWDKFQDLDRAAVQGNHVLLLDQSPADGSFLRDRESLVWTFSDAMTTNPGLAATGTVELLPPVAGSARWLHPNVLTFTPDQVWPEGQDVQVRIGLPPSLAGRRWEPRHFRFQGYPPTVQSFSRIGEDIAGRTLTLQVRLTQPLDEAVFLRALSLSVPTGDVPYAVTAAVSNRDYVVRTGRLDDNTVSVRFESEAGPDRPRRLLWETVCDVVTPMTVTETLPQEVRDGVSVKITFSQPPAPGWDAFLASDPVTNLAVTPGTGSTVWVRGLPAGAPADLLFRAGLPGVNGSVLIQDVRVALSLPELGARLRFRDRGHYLSSAGSRQVVLESVNVDAVNLAVWRVYSNNFVSLARTSSLYEDASGGWLWNAAEPVGDVVTNLALKPGAGRNRVGQTLVDLGNATTGVQEGVFYLVAEDATERHRAAHKLVVLTDLGLSVIQHDREVLVWAASIRRGEPVVGVEVSLFSTKNQLLGTATTDELGLARIGGEADLPPLSVVTAVKGGQLAMVKLGESLVQGPQNESDPPFLTGGYEAFLYADRGLYRPGETAHVRAVVRAPLLVCPAPFPVEARIRRPDGLLLTRLTGLLSEAGAAEFTVPVPEEAMTGRYPVELYLPGSPRMIGSLSLQVEEFVPPTLAVTVNGPLTRVPLDQFVPVSVAARHLFGSPASGRRVSLRARIGPMAFNPSLYKDYAFGDSRRAAVWRTLECGEQRLDASGKADFKLTLPADLRPAAALSCSVFATVYEDSGRACPALFTFSVDPCAYYIGLRPSQTGWKAGDTVRFQTVAVRPDGTPAPAPALRWSLARVVWNWREESDAAGRYDYRWDRTLEPVREGAITAEAGPVEIVWEQAEPGEYELAVSDATGAMAASSVFDVAGDEGWGAGGFRQPDRVTIRFDRDRYRAGDEAVVTLMAPFPGQALLTLENDRVRWARVLHMTGPSVEARIPVKADYWPNLFARAIVVRAQDAASASGVVSALRAVGVASMTVSRPEAAYRVDLTVPKRLRPLESLDVEVKVTDEAGNSVPASEVTVSAVDEGILRLTSYATPDPLRFFGASRNLAARLHDVYALILPDPETGTPAVRMHTGGDAMGAEIAGRLNPVRARRFVPVALWSGTVRTDDRGRARVSLPLPEFSGELRVTAVAVGANGFGQAAKAVPVRWDWVALPSLPRAVAPGDRFSLLCSVFNEGGVEGEATLQLMCKGGLVVDAGQGQTSRVTLAPGENRVLSFPLTASVAGVGEVALAIQAGEERWEERLEVPVRPPWPRVTLAGDGALYPGRVIRLEMPVPWVPKTGKGRLIASGLPGLEGLGALDFLERYPFGCLEQTLSCAFPLLVAEELNAAAGRGLLDRQKIGARVGGAIRRVAAMQTPSGGFALWPRELEVYEWGTAYAVLFLAEARAAGYSVPRELLDRACAYLEQNMADWLRHTGNVHAVSYAVAGAHALAVAGRPDQAMLSRLARLESGWDSDTRARLVSAFVAAGRRPEARALLEPLSTGTPVPLARDSGQCLRSSVRRDALLLDAWLQLEPDSPHVPLLVSRLIQARKRGQWETTQENAHALLALARYARHRKPGTAICRAQLTAENQETWELDESGMVEFTDARSLHNLTLRNSGDAVLYYAWTASGVPMGSAVQDEDSGIRIRRTVMDVNGSLIETNALHQGDLAIVKLTVDGLSGSADNLVIEELLPGGLEIENPALNRSYAAFLPADSERLPIRYQTLRDDRLIAFTGVVNNGGTLVYLVRAVTPGEYVWPPATVCGMYEPGIRSLNGGGKIRIDP